MRVRLSGAARQDLRNIALFIGADNPRRAFSYIDELEQACIGLEEQALRYAVMPGYEGRGYRRRPYGRYAIIYLVSQSDVLVVRVVASSMNLQDILDD